MSTTISAQRARTAALIAAALAALGCGESGPLTAPAHQTGSSPKQAIQPPTVQPVISARGASHSGYSLASGRVDSLQTPQGK